MASKNIFELLPDSDPETETHQDDKKPVKTEKKKEKNTSSSTQAQPKPKEGKAPAPKEDKPAGDRAAAYPKKKPQGGYNVEYLPKNDETKEKKHEKSGREGPKPFKGVPAEPHPMDRHSGTGRGKEVSKSGAGRRNWGTPEDDTKENRADRIDEKEQVAEQVAIEEVAEGEPKEKEPEVLTLEEYYKLKNIKHEAKEEPKEIKKKLDPTQTKIAGLDVVKSKEEVVEKAKQPKTVNKDTTSHKVVLNSENSDLLGFQTGLKTFAPRPPRKDAPERTERPPKQEKPAEETQPQQQAEEEGATEQQGEGEEQHQEGGRGGRGGRGGARGGRGRGGRGRGNKQEGGYREGGYKNEYRGPKEGGKKKEANLNLEDDKDFPSLA